MNATVYVDLAGDFPVTQQLRDFFRNQAATQKQTSRMLSQNLGNSLGQDLAIRGANAFSGIGNAVFSTAGEAVNLIDLGLDFSVGSSRVLSGTSVGVESRARVKATSEFINNSATSAASNTYSAVRNKGLIGATSDAVGSSASKAGGFLHKAYIKGDLEAGAKISGGLATAVLPGVAVSKVLQKGKSGSDAKLVNESTSKVSIETETLRKIANNQGSPVAKSFNEKINQRYEDQFQALYRGDSTRRKTFKSKLTEQYGSSISKNKLGEIRANRNTSDAFEQHSISSNNVDGKPSPFISLSSSRAVAERFARGVNGGQRGYVTEFRIPKNTAEFNFENRKSSEFEYFISDEVRKEFIYKQQKVNSNE